jgi:decaprenylphospho-beta-D-erythro-pentofuranosid-2-ulose 2-reductase
MKAVIIGATSGIAQEVARLYARDGASLFLVARDAAKLEPVAADLRVRGAANVETFVTDLRANHAEIVRRAGEGIDVVLIAHGTLPDQRAVDRDAEAQAEAFDLNATSVITLTAHFANVLESAKHGTIAVIGSVAGAAKAAVHAYCEGIRNRLAESNVAMVVIKPGWVSTPMTAGIKQNPLFASATSVASGIHAAIAKRRATVYLPGYWRWLSLVVRMLPGPLVKF